MDTEPESANNSVHPRAAFQHPAFAARISDVRRWYGEMYVDLRDTAVVVQPSGLHVQAGRLHHKEARP